MILEALKALHRTGELAQPPTEMLARVLFSALCEAAMTAADDRNASRAQRQARTALRTLTKGLRKPEA